MCFVKLFDILHQLYTLFLRQWKFIFSIWRFGRDFSELLFSKIGVGVPGRNLIE
jgi:hypothetical protein